MKSLHTLIKLAKTEVENRQKILAEVVARQDKIITQKNEAEANLASEKKAAEELPELAQNFGKFVKMQLEKIEKYNREIERLEKIIEQKREDLREAFAEQKRYEIALDLKIAEAKKLADKKEQITLDEIAARKARV